MSMLQKHQSLSSLALFFNTFFLINLTYKVLKQVAGKPGIWGQVKFFILQPFGICFATSLKYRGDAQKAITTQFMQDNSGLQVLCLCFVFEKFTSEKIASKYHSVIFSPKTQTVRSSS